MTPDLLCRWRERRRGRVSGRRRKNALLSMLGTVLAPAADESVVDTVVLGQTARHDGPLASGRYRR